MSEGRDYYPGMWVVITKDCRTWPSATGKIAMYEADEQIEGFPSDWRVPRLRLTSGDVIYGTECFWKPWEVAPEA